MFPNVPIAGSANQRDVQPRDTSRRAAILSATPPAQSGYILAQLFDVIASAISIALEYVEFRQQSEVLQNSSPAGPLLELIWKAL